MHLKLLELKGFKSFADNTEIEFQPGLNIIVGPNGCGKSNIVDAIRWVLGESNVRNLRGQRSEDVIFTGTDKKKPLGFASVSMNIDNQDQALSTDFSEITVTRKVYRTGESEFYINKNEVRLKDIHSLFAGTGLGKKGYSIIGQGELDQILNAKPFDRRLIHEEAAGLTKYRQKKEEAEAKLQSTAQDMLRVKDIIVELDNRVGDLKERAARAKKYLEVTGELGGLERRVMAYDIFLHRQEVQARMLEMAEFEQQIAAVKQEIEKLEAEYNGVQSYIEDIQKESSDLKDKKYVLGTEIGRQESDRKLAEERVRNASERLVQLREDVVKYTDMLTSLQGDLDKSRENLAVKQAELESKAVEADELTAEIEAARAELEAREKEIESIKGDLIEHLNYESNIKNRSLEKEEKVRKNQDKLGRGQNEINYRQEKLAVLQENLSVLDRDYGMEQKSLDGLGEEKAQCEKEKSAIAARRTELEKQIADLEKATRQLKNNILTLDEALKSHIGFSEGVRKLLDANRQEAKIPGLVGVITDLMEVPTGLEQAIEAAVGRGLENIVVKTDRDAQQAIELLKASGW
ncbi:MAG: chromosome segregation SMC family protein [Candidatus Saccharibacteria bacterium]